jgi:hypothetical protein
MSLQRTNQLSGPFCKITPATHKIFATTSFFFPRTVSSRTAARESTLHRHLLPGPAASELVGCLMRHRKPADAAWDAGGRCKSWRSSRCCAAAGAAWTEGFGTKSGTAAGDGADGRQLTDLRIQEASVRRFNLGAQAVGVASPDDGKVLFHHLLLHTLEKNDNMEITELELLYEVTAASLPDYR